MKQALIFDFDGVIVLSERARFQSLQQIAARYDVQIPDDLFGSIIGRTTKDFFTETLSHLSQEQLTAIMADYQVEYKDKITEHVTPIRFTNDFIRSYSGDKVVAITSGSDSTVIMTVLEHIGLRHKISCIVGKEHVTRHKPDPQAYLYTAEQLQLPPAMCTVFEDTAVGAQAALNAGMAVYAILNGINSEADFSGLPVKGFIGDETALIAAAGAVSAINR